YRSIARLDAGLARWPGAWRIVNPTASALDMTSGPAQPASAYRAVVVGYGTIGQMVSRLLRDGSIEPVIVETNLEATRRVRNEGYQVVYGDATQPAVLEAAGVHSAVALVVSGPASDQTGEIIRISRGVNPKMRVLARSNYLKETAILREAGADAVFS